MIPPPSIGSATPGKSRAKGNTMAAELLIILIVGLIALGLASRGLDNA